MDRRVEELFTSNRLVRRSDGADGASAAAEGEDGLDWRRTRDAIKRYRWLVTSVAVCGVLLTYFVTRRIAPQYRATASIWIAAAAEARPYTEASGPIRGARLLDADSWLDLMRSYVVLDSAVDQVRLYVHPRQRADSSALRALEVSDSVRADEYRLTVSDGRYTLTRKSDDWIETGVVGDSIGRSAGLRWRPDPTLARRTRPLRFRVESRRAAAERLATDLQLRIDEAGSFLSVTLSGDDPVTTARTVNAVVRTFVDVASGLKAHRLSDLTQILGSQLESAHGSLDSAERALESFRIRTVGSGVAVAAGAAATADGADELAATMAELDRVRHDRRVLATWLATPAHLVPSGGFPLLTTGRAATELTRLFDEAAAKRAELRALSYKLADAHPDVVQLRAELTQLQRETVPAAARELASELARLDADLAGRAAVRQQVARAIPPRLREEAQLRRAVMIDSALYAVLQRRYEEARLAQASTLPDLRVLDVAAPPTHPAVNASPRILLAGLAASLAAALALALILDRLDTRLRYPTDVSRHVGLAILGAVPHLRPRGATGTLAPDAVDEVTEALRGLRVAILQGAPVSAPLVLTISSPGAGDGKSFIAANLALSFAQAGHRTLLIDGDVRRGVLHRGFGGRRRPGLTDYLRGSARLQDVLQDTAYPSLSLVGCGTRTRTAPELLGGPTMRSLMDDLRRQYEVILCDSPPLSAGIDPFVLAVLSGELLVVLRSGVSVRRMVEAKLAVLDRLPVRIVGAVLNDMPPDELYRPYAYYLPGYQSTDEVEPPAALPVF